MLFSTFKRFGEIESRTLKKKEDGTSLGRGFVQFVNESSALAAIQALHGKEYNGKKISVVIAGKKEEAKKPEKKENAQKVD